MANILYGIHGTGHGHAMRGLTIARRLRQHNFLFVANDDALHILKDEFPIVKIPNLGTVFKNYRVDLPATIAKALPLILQREKYIKQVLKVIDDFKPDVCMTDLEYFVPLAAARAGLKCLTLDHQHVIVCCKHAIPLNMYFDYFVQGLTPKYLFKPTEYNLIVSFYAPPVLPQYNAQVVAPILRDTVISCKSHDAGHILVYQSNSTHKQLIEVLKKGTERVCHVFGYGREEGRDGNIIFEKKSEQRFLELLAGASYIVQGGGHTLMTESLYLGKPILTLPLKAMIEQRLNALYIEKLGYGMQSGMTSFAPELLKEFEQNLSNYANKIAGNNFCGNELVFSLVDKFINQGSI